MSKVNYVSESNLSRFKTKQDEYNLTKFASLSGGKVTAEQLPSYVDDIIEGYASDTGTAVVFYYDAQKTQPITGETGKIYLDLAATIDGSYRYSGSQFVPIGNSVSTADKAIHDASGNIITETYATKDEVGAAASKTATNSTLGIVKIGNNVGIEHDGTIYMSDTQVTSALGYVPLSSSDISPLSDADIDKMFL